MKDRFREKNRESDAYYPLKPFDINYAKAGARSVDGDPDPNILNLISRIRGESVLECAAGDGRYTEFLLRQGNSVVAGDLYHKPMAALREKMPGGLERGYHPVQFDAFQTFPFKDGQFDAIVCTGFLYLFPEEMLKRVVGEYARVSKPKARLIVDFATGIKRERPNGELVRGPSEVNYDLSNGMNVLSRVFRPHFSSAVTTFTYVDQNLTGPGQPGYRMTNTKINTLATRL